MPSPTKTETFLKNRLKQLRQKAEFTQNAISELAGISYIYYQSIEAGRRPNVSLRVIEQIANVYGIGIHELFAPVLPEIRVKKQPLPPPHQKKRAAKSN